MSGSRHTAGEPDEEEEEMPWVLWWCSLRGNEFLCEVSENFIRDQFNLTGLSSQVAYYEEALDILLDIENEESYTEEAAETVQSSAETLYGLIHARYILTQRGLQQMAEKFKRGEFGKCARVHCEGQHVVPVGLSDRYGEHTAKLYCPRCEDVYTPRSTRQGNTGLDGAFFGTTFPHMLLHVHPDLLPAKRGKTKYTPRIYGFKIHPTAWQRPQRAPTKPELSSAAKEEQRRQRVIADQKMEDANYPGEDPE